MTKYIIFPDAATAKARNQAIAKRLGCGRDPEDMTEQWFSVIEKRDPENPQDNSKDCAFVVPDDEYPLLDLEAPGHSGEILRTAEAKALPPNAATVAQLKTDAELKAEGWASFKDVPNGELEAPPIVGGMKLSSDWLWKNAIQPIVRLFG